MDITNSWNRKQTWISNCSLAIIKLCNQGVAHSDSSFTMRALNLEFTLGPGGSRLIAYYISRSTSITRWSHNGRMHFKTLIQSSIPLPTVPSHPQQIPPPASTWQWWRRCGRRSSSRSHTSCRHPADLAPVCTDRSDPAMRQIIFGEGGLPLLNNYVPSSASQKQSFALSQKIIYTVPFQIITVAKWRMLKQNAGDW